ncbi:hypothetical protein AB0A89_34905, partial [Streptomyces albogriseolus]
MSEFSSSQALRDFFKWLLGLVIPALDEDRLRAFALGILREVARALDDANVDLSDGAQKIRRNVVGRSEEGFAESVERLASLMGKGTRFARVVGRQHHFAAGATYSTKVTGYTTSALLLFELQYVTSIFWINPAPYINFWSSVPLVRGSVWSFFGRVLEGSEQVFRLALQEALEEVISTLAGEIAAVKKGYNPGKVDVHNVAVNGAMGFAFGGAMGAAMGPARKLGAGAARALGGDGLVRLAGDSGPGRAVVRGAAGGGEKVIDGVTETVIELPMTLMAGGSVASWNPATTFVSSVATDAMLDATNSAAGRLGDLIAGHQRPPAGGSGADDERPPADGADVGLPDGAEDSPVEAGALPAAAGSIGGGIGGGAPPTSSAQTSSAQTSSAQTSSGQASSAQTSSGQASSGQASSGQASSGQASGNGGGQAGAPKPSSGPSTPPGQDRPVPVGVSGSPGQDRPLPVGSALTAPSPFLRGDDPTATATATALPAGGGVASPPVGSWA